QPNRLRSRPPRRARHPTPEANYASRVASIGSRSRRVFQERSVSSSLGSTPGAWGYILRCGMYHGVIEAAGPAGFKARLLRVGQCNIRTNISGRLDLVSSRKRIGTLVWVPDSPNTVVAPTPSDPG